MGWCTIVYCKPERPREDVCESSHGVLVRWFFLAWYLQEDWRWLIYTGSHTIISKTECSFTSPESE